MKKSIYRVIVTSDDGKMLAQFCIDESDKNGRIKSTVKVMGEIGKQIVKHKSFIYIVNGVQIFRDYVEESNDK